VAVLVVRDQRLVARPFLVRDVAGPVDLGAELGRQAGATVAEGGCLFLLADVAGLNPRALQGEPPAFGCYFNCAGRGRGLFGVPDHDVTLIRQHLGAFPLIGFFGNGEFAPIGRRNFFHNYTGALVVFPA
jgi:hypothetical protein